MARLSPFIIFNLCLLQTTAQPIDEITSLGRLRKTLSESFTRLEAKNEQTYIRSKNTNVYDRMLTNDSGNIDVNILHKNKEGSGRKLGKSDKGNHSLALPKELVENVSDVSEPSKKSDTPVFWHVSKSGGTTMVDIISTCFGFVVSAEMGVLEGHGNDEELKVVDLNEGLRYVNVDTTTIPGIHRAAKLQLVPSHLADVIVTPYFVDASKFLFNPANKARMFTILRHPIDRAVSMFFYLQNASWETTYDVSLKNMTLLEYAESDKAEDNWMTRFLVNKPNGPMYTEDLVLAREILRRKFLIGLLSYMDESIVRFERYFKWATQKGNIQQCVKQKWTNKHQHPKLEEGSQAWNALMTKNGYDMELYSYAHELFQDQRKIFTLNEDEDDKEKQ